jgi:hypothetical protein
MQTKPPTANHTPGPWEIALTNNHCILGPSPTGLCVVACLPHDGTQLPNTAANAALMAAAPALLAALEECLLWIETPTRPWCATVDQARAALALAKGQP